MKRKEVQEKEVLLEENLTFVLNVAYWLLFGNGIVNEGCCLWIVLCG